MSCQNPDLRPLLADFVLELLPEEQERRVAAHLARCAACREALQREREVGQQVRQAIAAAPALPAARLHALLPARPRRRWSQALLWRPAAALAVFLFLLLGSLQLNPAGGAALPPTASATVLAATATHIPTTAPARESIEQTPALGGAAVGPAPIPIAAVNANATPAPLGWKR